MQNANDEEFPPGIGFTLANLAWPNPHAMGRKPWLQEENQNGFTKIGLRNIEDRTQYERRDNWSIPTAPQRVVPHTLLARAR